MKNSCFNFPKQHRLLNKNDFQNLRSGSRFFISGSLLFYIKDTQKDFSRLGIAVSKKYGKAVNRNRFKRLVREVFRAERAVGYDMLVLPNLKLMQKKKLSTVDIENNLKSDFLAALSKSFKR